MVSVEDTYHSWVKKDGGCLFKTNPMFFLGLLLPYWDPIQNNNAHDSPFIFLQRPSSPAAMERSGIAVWCSALIRLDSVIVRTRN